jgi:hypothetical protein
MLHFPENFVFCHECLLLISLQRFEIVRSSSTVAAGPRSTPITRKGNDTSQDIDLDVNNDEIFECVFERTYYTVNQLTSSISI